VISLNISKLLRQLGGPLRLRQLLDAYDQPVPEATAVAQWKARNALPRKWTAPVLFVLARQGIDPISLLDDTPRDSGHARDRRLDDPFADDDDEYEATT